MKINRANNVDSPCWLTRAKSLRQIEFLIGIWIQLFAYLLICTSRRGIRRWDKGSGADRRDFFIMEPYGDPLVLTDGQLFGEISFCQRCQWMGLLRVRVCVYIIIIRGTALLCCRCNRDTHIVLPLPLVLYSTETYSQSISDNWIVAPLLIIVFTELCWFLLTLPECYLSRETTTVSLNDRTHLCQYGRRIIRVQLGCGIRSRGVYWKN